MLGSSLVLFFYILILLFKFIFYTLFLLFISSYVYWTQIL